MRQEMGRYLALRQRPIESDWGWRGTGSGREKHSYSCYLEDTLDNVNNVNNVLDRTKVQHSADRRTARIARLPPHKQRLCYSHVAKPQIAHSLHISTDTSQHLSHNEIDTKSTNTD